MLKDAVKALMPPILLSAFRRLRHGPPKAIESYRASEYQGVKTRHNARPLHIGRFAQLHERHCPLDPNVAADTTRLRHYNLSYFAQRSMHVAGDLAFVGISYGVAPRIIFDLLDLGTSSSTPKGGGKTMHLVDPFLGIRSSSDRSTLAKYNADMNFVRDQYPADAGVKIHAGLIPDCLPIADRFCFVHLNTGDCKAEALSLPHFWQRLSPGGVVVIDNYAIDDGHFEDYAAAIAALGVDPFWMPTGQCVVEKPCTGAAI